LTAWQAEQVLTRNPKNRVAPSEEIEEKIRERAYAIWEQEGRPDGKHLEHWSRAKRMIAAAELHAAAGAVLTHEAAAMPHALDDGDE
jgi:hypothetical protein